MAHVNTTITNTSYGAAAHTFNGTGWLTVAHRGEDGDPDVIVSFDGVTDDKRVPPRGILNSDTPDAPPAVYLRLSSAGSVTVLVQRSPRSGG